MDLLTFLSWCFFILTFQESIGQAQAQAYNEETFAKYSCDNKDIQQLIVDRHNELRSQVQPTPGKMMKMKWSDEAAKNAKAWAQQCKLVHSKPNQRQTSKWGCGENLYMSNKLVTWHKAMQGWYDEVNDFTYGEGQKDPSKPVGHYTQFVWGKSFEVGCAMAYCPHLDLCIFVVCHYCPAGNEKATRNSPYVPAKPCSSCDGHCSNGLCTNYCYVQDQYEDCPLYSDLCDTTEESLEEDEQVKNTCRETCECNRGIY